MGQQILVIVYLDHDVLALYPFQNTFKFTPPLEGRAQTQFDLNIDMNYMKLLAK